MWTGVDLEPNYSIDRLENITFRRCEASNNTACGFTISPHNLLHNAHGPPLTSASVDVTFEDCHVDARGQLSEGECEAQHGCGWTTRAGFTLSGFPANITGSIDFIRCSTVGGTYPAVQLDAKGLETEARFKDCVFGNDAGSATDPSPVFVLEPCASGKFHTLYGPYPYGAVAFDNVTVVLGEESEAARKHHRPWMSVVAADGLSNVDLNASIVALPGSGGCALVKEEHVNAKQPWRNVTMGHTCADSPAAASELVTKKPSWKFSATLDLPADRGQALGTFFEVVDSTGRTVAHAGGVLSEGTYLNNALRQLSFYVDSAQPQQPTWTDLGRPFPEAFCQTRCASINGSLLVFNRDLSAAQQNFATLRPGTGAPAWDRGAPPPDVPATWQAAVNTCGGLMSFGETAILFNGVEIWSLDTDKFGYQMSSFVDGKMLIYAMTKNTESANATGASATNAIMIGHWNCDATERVKIVATWTDPTPLDQQWHNTPYTWLMLPESSFLVGANLGDVYKVNETSFSRVHRANFPAASWQPYTMIRTGDTTYIGQYPTGGVFTYNSRDGLTFPKANVGVEPGASSADREAMTLSIYGKDLLLGMWPWGTLYAARSPRELDLCCFGLSAGLCGQVGQERAGGQLKLDFAQAALHHALGV